MSQERIVLLRPRTIFTTAALIVAFAAALWVVYTARQALTWVLVSIFLALALNPAVAAVQNRFGVTRRGAAAAVIYLLAILVLIGLGFLLIPPIADQVNGLAKAAPGYVEDLTKGRGPLGFLETKYHVVEKVREGVGHGGSAAGVLGGASAVLSITRGVITAIVGIVTIAFMTFFMLLEGPTWIERIFALVPRNAEPRWRRVGDRIAETVSGYVTGNLLISMLAGAASAI